MALRESSLIVQGMAMLEDYTPIKPLLGKGNTFEDAMFYPNLFGLTQAQVLTLVAIGLAYAVLVVK